MSGFKACLIAVLRSFFIGSAIWARKYYLVINFLKFLIVISYLFLCAIILKKQGLNTIFMTIS